MPAVRLWLRCPHPFTPPSYESGSDKMNVRKKNKKGYFPALHIISFFIFHFAKWGLANKRRRQKQCEKGPLATQKKIKNERGFEHVTALMKPALPPSGARATVVTGLLEVFLLPSPHLSFTLSITLFFVALPITSELPFFFFFSNGVRLSRQRSPLSYPLPLRLAGRHPVVLRARRAAKEAQSETKRKRRGRRERVIEREEDKKKREGV